MLAMLTTMLPTVVSRWLDVIWKKNLKEYGTTTNLPREGRPPGKEGIKQRGNKETNDNPGRSRRALQLRLEYLSMGPL
jgi:hypothetical protein